MDAAALEKAIRQELAQRFAFYQPHAKQALFHKLGAECRERLFLGGNRTGKTVCGVHECSMHLTGVYPDWWEGRRFAGPVNVWAASNTTETTRDILQAQYLGIRGSEGTIHPASIVATSSRRGVADAVDTATIRHKTGGLSVLGFKSYDQGREKFQGTHQHVVHLDEEPPLDVYDECLLRTAGFSGEGKESGIIVMTMTPLGGMTSLMQSYTEGMVSGDPKDGRVFVQAGWEDNTYLPREEWMELEKRFASRPHELEARKLGIPSIGSGMIYPIEESRIVCDPFEIPPHFRRCAGMDFGWTNPTAVVWGAHDADTDIVYIYAEYAQSELPPQTHVNNIQRLGAWIPVVCDPAGQASSQADGESLLNRYLDHGLNVSRADNAVETGLQEVFERMLTGRLKIFSTCTGVLSERRVYARDEKGRVKKMNDHRMDALRYLVVSGLGLARSKHDRRNGEDFYYAGALSM